MLPSITAASAAVAAVGTTPNDWFFSKQRGEISSIIYFIAFIEIWSMYVVCWRLLLVFGGYYKRVQLKWKFPSFKMMTMMMGFLFLDFPLIQNYVHSFKMFFFFLSKVSIPILISVDSFPTIWYYCLLLLFFNSNCLTFKEILCQSFYIIKVINILWQTLGLWLHWPILHATYGTACSFVATTLVSCFYICQNDHNSVTKLLLS